MRNDIDCMGFRCTVRNQCERYTKPPVKGHVIRKCTNTKLFLQDEDKVNGDALRR